MISVSRSQISSVSPFSAAAAGYSERSSVNIRSAAVSLICHKNKVPYIIVKCVSDGLLAEKDDYHKNFTETAKLCFDVCNKVLNEF